MYDEGCAAIYDRRKAMVFPEANDAIEAITYIMNDQSQETPPSPEYLAIIKQGYHDWDLV